MKHKSLILIGFLMLTAVPTSWAQLTKKVLFIGNSYTARNALAETVKQLALSAGDTLIYDVHSPGGQRFFDHASNPVVYSKMRSQDWDYVILQGQSQEPSWSDAQVNTQVRPYVNQLVDSIYSTSSCAIPMFYMTWGRKNGDALNCASWPPVCTYLGMDSILRKNYLDFAVSREGEAAPVGAVWRQIRQDYPSIELYTADESHPSIAGTYAAAATFYASIFHKDPTACSFITVDTATAGKIKRTARDVVLDSLFLWNIREYEPYDSIKYSVIENLEDIEVHLTAPLMRGAIYTWEKEGEFKMGREVSFLYDNLENGHTFKLQIQYCDSIINDSVFVYHYFNFGLPEWTENKLQLYPNPSRDELIINQAQWESASIYNVEGELLLKFGEHSDTLDISDLESGVYYLILESNELTQFGKFIKQ
ncbi:MAG: T9SS type A sorting domain-containing protein [Bacteroidia bacterium]